MLNKDALKLAFVFAVLSLVAFVFFWTEALRPTALLTLLNLILLTPAIRWLQSKALTRSQSILIVFSVSAFVVLFGVVNGIQLLQDQWATLLETLPSLWPQVLDRINRIQEAIETKMGVKLGTGASTWLIQFGNETQNWILTRLPRVLADAASAAFLVPIFSYFMLKDGPQFRDQLYRFLPESFRSTSADVIRGTSNALAVYLRAKMIEATSVGLLAWIGFWIIGAPYAGILAFFVGITNVIPYLGIVLGAAPPLLIFSMTESMQGHFWPALIVLVLVNAIDTLLIFPVFVAKIVNLSPMTLLAAVAVGQEYYGLVGMLIAVPLASILKIIYLEIVEALYGPPIS